ncbi:MAG: acyltransferase [Deltaproteobacteria bacterium]|nr:acyltransferase [Deltaproteobacteria bacterium]
MSDDDGRREDLEKARLSWMPWRWLTLGGAARAWAEPWQAAVRARVAGPGVTVGEGVFVAPDARLLAEPGRAVVLGARTVIGTDVFVHGPAELGEAVIVHPRVVIDGARAGVVIGAGTRIANGAMLMAFDHGSDPTAELASQPVTSRGIEVGRDVWIGAGAIVCDGVTVGDHAVIEAGAVVASDVPAWAVVGGAPGRVVGDRRDQPDRGR